MKNYENYLFLFDYLSYIDKTKYGEFTGKYTKFGHLVYKPLSMDKFERKLLLDFGFDTKWNVSK